MEKSEKDNEIAISKEDVDNVREFFQHFGIEMPPYLNAILEKITDSDQITLDSQQELKAALARAVVENKEEAIFKDEIFKEAIPKCEKEHFYRQFELDFEQIDSTETE